MTTHPYVRDHCVYEQPDWWPDDADRFPVVPMTTLVDLAGAEALTAAGPGRVVAGYTDVRALRWLPVAPATTTDVVRIPVDADRVRIEFGAFTSAVVVLADARTPRPAPAPDGAPLTNEGPAPVRAHALYADRWMFHGSGFAGVEQVLTLADDGIRGILRTLPAPGALLDAAGQLLGHWMQVRLPTDRLVFPMSVEAIDLYGPRPATGSRLLTTARIRDVTPTTVRGDVELVDPDTGLVRIRVRGWVYRRFAADERVWPMKFTPHTTGIGEPQPEGWCLLRTRWPDPASQDLVMRRYLNRAERAEFATKAPRARQSWLLGRVAVKDAVRRYVWRGGHGPLYPAQVEVTHHGDGRPLVRVVGGPGDPEAGPPPVVSVAHSHRLAVALARAEPAGIDIELIDPGSDASALERSAFGADERRLLDTLAGHDRDLRHRWVLRFWCAKEAAGKADGTGLAGRPLDRLVTSVLPDHGAQDAGLHIASRAPGGPAHLVRTRVVEDAAPDGSRVDHYVVAWTCAEAEPTDPTAGAPATRPATLDLLEPAADPEPLARPDTPWSTP
ncbi:4'-phosphopantetheinyl transferase superfamily protein [Streptomyces sp. SID3343]|nr:4'-phosphopantetheinyl transferase superfamily protein [Streptomyces sp. SID3343]